MNTYLRILTLTCAVLSLFGAADCLQAGTRCRSSSHTADLCSRAEIWYRIKYYELDHGKWRYAGSDEKPDYRAAVRLGENWKSIKPGYRNYRIQPFRR
jgi:hypothetical protein